MNWVISTKTKPTTKRINTSFRDFTVRDIPLVLTIERLVYDSPWSQAKFTDSLNNPKTLSSLLIIDDQVLGYFVATHSPDSMDLLNICIHPEHQHQGLGTQLFDYLSQQLQALSLNTIFIEVRASNKSALLFYQKLGFNLIDSRKKYYSNGEDAKILRLQTR
ncbi:MAG TPA: ribosomal-protein-alanine N-acetyltransferase [Gammaproteobacteria bacterium]|nr:ribosomal-protein-alanine N-acetyltransferase [Gammaproteobacteria bacterium]